MSGRPWYRTTDDTPANVERRDHPLAPSEECNCRGTRWHRYHGYRPRAIAPSMRAVVEGRPSFAGVSA